VSPEVPNAQSSPRKSEISSGSIIPRQNERPPEGQHERVRVFSLRGNCDHKRLAQSIPMPRRLKVTLRSRRTGDVPPRARLLRNHPICYTLPRPCRRGVHHPSCDRTRGSYGSNSRQSSLNTWRRRKSNSLEPVCAARGVEEFSVISVRSNANGFASARLQGEEARRVRFPIYRDDESGRLSERR